MIRGTTPRLSFTLPFSTGIISECYITFTQLTTIILEKTLSDCEQSEDTLILNLSQEDTLTFIESVPVKIQLRIKTKDNKALASNIINTTADLILKDGVI